MNGSSMNSWTMSINGHKVIFVNKLSISRSSALFSSGRWVHLMRFPFFFIPVANLIRWLDVLRWRSALEGSRLEGSLKALSLDVFLPKSFQSN